MPYYEFQWRDSTIEHLAEHDISPDDFEEVVCNPFRKGKSRSSGRRAAWGYTRDGRYVIAVYEEIDELVLLPVTAYEVPEPR
jgi:uncharacterized DUF497 family protein